jgi:hypothetical protein
MSAVMGGARARALLELDSYQTARRRARRRPRLVLGRHRAQPRLRPPFIASNSKQVHRMLARNCSRTSNRAPLLWLLGADREGRRGIARLGRMKLRVLPATADASPALMIGLDGDISISEHPSLRFSCPARPGAELSAEAVDCDSTHFSGHWKLDESGSNASSVAR